VSFAAITPCVASQRAFIVVVVVVVVVLSLSSQSGNFWIHPPKYINTNSLAVRSEVSQVAIGPSTATCSPLN
jgi:hypothetical protein